jgi:hypothetical protein
MASGYPEDLLLAMKAQTEFIKKQALFEIIQVVAVCDTYEDFKKALYGKAIEFMKEMEAEGTLKPGFTAKVIQNSKEKGEL